MFHATATSSLSTPLPVPAHQIAAFRENGHILLEHVLPPAEVPVHRASILRATEKFNTEKRPLAARDTYGKAFLQVMNLWEVDESVRAFTLAKRFAQIAADLMGVARVRLYHDQALFKEPGGGHTPWHQDQYYWPIDTHNTLTMWMPLVDIAEGMGMLTFASGSHRDGMLGNMEISDDSEATLGRLVREKGYPICRPQSMRAGDATFHSGWTLHSAPGNHSDKMREVMTVIYMADGAKVTKPRNPDQENDRQRWLNGLAPGETIDSPLNPLL